MLVGVLGFVGIIGPTPEDSLFGDLWWFDNGENWAHLVLGLAALIAYKVLGESMQRWLVAAVGLLGLVVTVYGFVVGENLLGANLENPSDNILHLVIGLWALYAAKGGKSMSSQMQMPM